MTGDDHQFALAGIVQATGIARMRGPGGGLEAGADGGRGGRGVTSLDFVEIQWLCFSTIDRHCAS